MGEVMRYWAGTLHSVEPSQIGMQHYVKDPVVWASDYDDLAARLAEAVAALHDIAHAEPEASALRLRFMAADALIRHNTADSADEVQP